MAYLKNYKETPEEEKVRASRALRYSEKFGTRLPSALRPLVEMYLGATILAEHDEFHGIVAREDGVVMIPQTCKDGCGGVWSASIEMRCPYCFGEGKQRSRSNRN